MEQKINRVKILSYTILAIGLIVLLAILFNKLLSFQEGIDGESDIKGTYELKKGGELITYLTIDYGEDRKEFQFSPVEKSAKVSGTVKKDEGNYYVLYDQKTETIYAKIIPSYKKIYLIDNRLNITEYNKISEVFIRREFKCDRRLAHPMTQEEYFS